MVDMAGVDMAEAVASMVDTLAAVIEVGIMVVDTVVLL